MSHFLLAGADFQRVETNRVVGVAGVNVQDVVGSILGNMGEQGLDQIAVRIYNADR